MSVRRELAGAVGILLGLQVVSSFAAIGLLGRMGPAIQHLLDENLTTVTSVEQMLSTLASLDGEPANRSQMRRFEQALADANEHVTEPAGSSALEIVVTDAPKALEGDDKARVRVVAALERVGQSHIAGMRRADETARKIGTAGAWAAVAIGMTSFGLSVLVSRRLTRPD